MTGSFGAKLKLEKQKAEIRISQFQPAPKAQLSYVVPISQFLLFPTDGGEKPHTASNHTLLYLLSMLYDAIAPSTLFPARFDHFEENQHKSHRMNYLRSKPSFPIKPNQA